MKWDNSFSGIEYYSNVKSSSVEWIWYPYIPCGKITILQGDPGEGKSTLILHIDVAFGMSQAIFLKESQP